MQDQHQHHRERAEDDCPDQAHAPADVEFPLRVVPPPGVEQLFHQPRRQIFQTARHHRAGKKQQHRVLNPAQHEQHQHRTRAVDRTVRTVQKAAVDELPVSDGADRTFIHPADDAVDHQPEKPGFDCFQNVSSSLVLPLLIHPSALHSPRPMRPGAGCGRFLHTAMLRKCSKSRRAAVKCPSAPSAPLPPPTGG